MADEANKMDNKQELSSVVVDKGSMMPLDQLEKGEENCYDHQPLLQFEEITVTDRAEIDIRKLNCIPNELYMNKEACIVLLAKFNRHFCVKEAAMMKAFNN